MKFPPWLTVYGDQSFRGNCPKEESDQVSLFSWLQWQHPALYAIAIHPKIEGKRTWQQIAAEKKTGALKKGVIDVVIPGCPSLCLELKRRDHTKSVWKDGQPEYLWAAKNNGSIVCVALGFDAACHAIEDYIKIINRKR